MRDTLLTPRTARYLIGSILTNNKIRTPAIIAAVQALVDQYHLSPVVADFGFFNDAVFSNQCTWNAGQPQVSSPDNPWTAADVGKPITLQGAGSDNTALRSTIKSFTDAGNIVLANDCVTTNGETSAGADGLAIWGLEVTSTLRADPLKELNGNPDQSSNIAIRNGLPTFAGGRVPGEYKWLALKNDALVPTGLLECLHQAVSRVQYADLFAAIGTLYGAGDGVNTFNLPSGARRTLIGAGGAGTATIGASVGDTGGEETHTLTALEMANHTHGYNDPLIGGGSRPSAEGYNGTYGNPGVTGGVTGGSPTTAGHNNMQPAIVARLFIVY